MVETKFRDVPWEVIESHFKHTPPNAKELWNKVRGQPVTLTGEKIVFENARGETIIGWYVLPNPGEIVTACSECAEIGD